MEIKLRNIKYFAEMSEETPCYHASLYVDGKRIGKVWNEGHGGPDGFSGDEAAYHAADAWIKANTPAKTVWGMEIDPDIEQRCMELLTEHLMRRDLKRDLKKAVLFLKTPRDGALYEVKPKGGMSESGTEMARKIVRERHPEAVILNDLPESQALAYYQSVAE